MGRRMQDNWATNGVTSVGGMQAIRKLVQVPYLQYIGRGTFAKQALTLIATVTIEYYFINEY